jgi:hypothetical protein
MVLVGCRKMVSKNRALKNFEHSVFKSEEDKAKSDYIKSHPLLLGVFVRIYQGLCPRCKASATMRVRHKHKVEISQFCEACQVRANKLMEDAKNGK